MELALLILRVVVGVLLIGHGAQKVFGWFGGHGPAGTGGFFESLGLRPGRPLAVSAGAAEMLGGLLLALGLLTSLGSMLVIGVMFVAILTAHRGKGPWATEGGYEYNLVLIAVAFALAGVGPGEWSLDHALDLDTSGDGWALGALAAGVFGGALLVWGARMMGRGDRADRPAAVGGA
jgi:putative oxidoreductase